MATADSIKATFANPLKISDATVAALCKLLPAGAKDDEKRPAIRAKTRKGPTSALSSDIKSNSDSKRTKLCLATHIVNVVLKALSEANKAQRERRDSSCNSTHLIPLAGCGRIALNYLRTHEKDPGERLPTFQVDNASLSFVDKCLALEMYGHDLMTPAYQELCVVKERLDLCLVQGADEQQKTKYKFSGNFEQDMVCQLFCFDSKPAESSLRSTMISHQFAALKFLLRLNDEGTLKTSCRFIWIGWRLALIHLLEEQVADEDLWQKTTLQVEKLLAIVSSIHRAISIKDKAARSTSLATTLPVMLKATALYGRLIRWTLSKSALDVEKDIWAPLAKAFKSLARESCTDLENWLWVHGLFLDRLRELGHLKKPASLVGAHGDVFDSLIGIARSTARYKEALTLMDRRYKDAFTVPGISDAKKSFLVIRYADLRLNGDSTLIGRQCLLQKAAMNLEGGNRGSVEELYELLSEILLLQKSAYKFYSDTNASDAPSSETLGSAVLCRTLVCRCLKFLLRFISRSNPDAARTEDSYSKRRTVASKVARNSIIMVLQCCKQQISSTAIKFDDLDCSLRDAVAVADKLEINGVYDRVSNLYWAFAKSDDADDTTKVKAVKRSVEVLEGRAIEEKVTGQYSTKLETLADIYASAKEISRAQSYATESARHQIETGLLKSAASLSSTQSLHLIQSAGELGRFLRTLSTLQQFRLNAAKSDQLPACFDDNDLSEEERGVLLEMQLHLLLESRSLQLGRASRSQRIQGSELLDKLLAVYSQDKFPVRRLRVVIAYIRACHLDLLSEDDLLPNITSRACAKLGEDAGLRQYHRCMNATLDAHLAFLSTPVDLAKFEQALAVWQDVVDKARSRLDLEAHVDDPEIWIDHLSHLADYFDMKDLSKLLIPTLCLLDKIYQIWNQTSTTSIASNLSKLALVWSRIGYSNKAQICLDKVQTFLSDDVPIEVHLGWHFAVSEHSILALQFEKSAEAVQAAESLVDAHPDFSNEHNLALGFTKRLRCLKVMADFCYVSGKHNLSDNNKTKEALSLARQCVKLNQTLWSNLENRLNPKSLDAKSDVDTDIDTTQDEAVEASMTDKKPTRQSPDYGTLNHPRLWQAAGPLFRAYTLLSSVYAHSGSFQEAMYYAELAEKVARGVGSPSRVFNNTCLRISLRVTSGDTDNAREDLDAALSQAGDMLNPLDKAVYYKTLALVHHGMGESAQELSEYNNSLGELQLLSQDSTSSGPFNELQVAKDEGNTKPSSSKAAAGASRTKVGSNSRKRNGTPISASQRADSNNVPSNYNLHTKSWVAPSLKYEVLLGKALARSVSIGTSDEYADIFEVPKLILSARHILESVLRIIASSPAFSTILESVLALPSVALLANDTSSHGGPKRTTKVLKSKSGSKRVNAQEEGSEELMSLLSEARDRLQSGFNHVLTTASTAVVHHASDILREVSMLLSAVTQNDAVTKVHPLCHSSILENPRSDVFRRQLAISQAESMSKNSSKALRWPESKTLSHHSNLDASASSQQDIGSLPSAWTVISMTLDDEKDKLSICRYRSIESPFTVQIPLNRASVADPDGVWTFEHGKAKLASFIARIADGLKKGKANIAKEEGRKWWDERHELDKELKNFVHDVEKYWFSGYKGIFAPQPTQQDLFANFKQTLQTALNRHLPSRQGLSLRSPFHFDPRIVELFIGLGNPNGSHGVDFDDALEALLGFVVEILNRSGESNAYDEVEFDPLIIDVRDALEEYHTSISETATDTPYHVILVLDKHLHAFPWESLPCLSDLSISRLPSLAALQSRLLAAKSTEALLPSHHNSLGLKGHFVSRSSGYSMLNISGDLLDTEGRISPFLQQLPRDWSLQTSPTTEGELAQMLSLNDIFLYFGHGSGKQYIRPRTVKNLGTCPTTWLMGCSSAFVSEHSSFETTGMILSFVQAGAPAVVGALWDVTDKDADRASLSAGDSWGLWKAPGPKKKGWWLQRHAKRLTKQDGEVEAPRKDKSTAEKPIFPHYDGTYDEPEDKGRQSTDVKGKCSLVEAIRRSREDCYLRYLNGAALVVYGIPVYLVD